MFELHRIYHFEAAHYLPLYEGACHRLHGHSYKVVIKLRNNILIPRKFGKELTNLNRKDNSDYGMVMDFHKIDQSVSPIIDRLEHQTLNDLIDYPTAELIAKWIYDQIVLTAQLPLLYSVQVWETERSMAEYWNGDLK